ncbi:MAG TPA: acyl-CoA dehydrogenase family protein [Streptosporangiaceae bacterium]|nr:acyl-CoA dehydrogenase family protein [Streptosporangiaceae bacterium]
MTESVLTPDGIRAELAAWVARHWDPDMPLREWRELLADSGWGAPSWPERWHGRGWPAWTDDVVAVGLIALGAVGAPVGLGMTLAAPTLLAHASDDVKQRLLRPILTGEQTWCQLFSEPGAGSDLAGLSTSAARDGAQWVVNGQKVWNTSAHHADMGMLLARTDSQVPKHRGLTYLALPMSQPGVEVRPLRQMNFHASFNEVFLTGALVPGDNVVGEVGQGWAVALTTLAYERRFGAMRPPAYDPRPGTALDEARAESDAHFAVYSWYPQRAGRADLVIEHARSAGVADDPVIRQAIARVVTLQRVSTWTAERARAARAAGARPGAEGSVGKLALSNLARESARAHAMIARAGALLTGPDSPLEGVIGEVLLSVPAQSIAGGTDEIQRNILAEKILGLPPEIRTDKDLPFSQVRARG